MAREPHFMRSHASGKGEGRELKREGYPDVTEEQEEMRGAEGSGERRMSV